MAALGLGSAVQKPCPCATLYKASTCVRMLPLQHINAAWMVMPVSNAVSAMVGPIVEIKYKDACQFW